MPITLRPPQPDDLPALASICHRAFDALHLRHNVHRDVPTEEVGALIIGGVLRRPDYTGVVAVEDGRPIGSNFLLFADEVCGVGPITVDPSLQSQGTGRALMQWVIDEARRRRGPEARVRLFQEALNTTSLSLYTRLGFRWQYAAALMHPAPAAADDASIRPLTPADLPHVGRLSAAHHGFSRANDAARLMDMGLPAFARERGGRVVGYQIATLFGHAAGETVADLIALASHTARAVPPPMAVVIVPLNQPGLFDACLSAGFRVAKVLNAMSIGAFAPPPGPSMPSIQC